MGVYLYPNNTETELKNAYIWISNPTSIVLDKSSISLTTIWQTEQLTATIEPTISDHSITWSSDDTSVATVSTTGLVTCVTPWECTITATTVNGLTASCSVEQWWQPWVNTIAYYKFDWNLNDSSGNSRNLWTQSWTFTYWTESWWGKYIQTGSGVRSTQIAMPFNQEAYTISFYCSYSPNTHWIWATVFDLYSSSYGSSMTRCVYYWSWVMNNELSMLDHNWVYYTPSVADSWHYYTFTFDGTNMKLYVDSNYIGSVSKWADANLTSLNFKIWWVVWQNNNNFYGTAKIWNFILENKTWSSWELTNYYNQTKADYWL